MSDLFSIFSYSYIVQMPQVMQCLSNHLNLLSPIAYHYFCDQEYFLNVKYFEDPKIKSHTVIFQFLLSHVKLISMENILYTYTGLA